MLAASLKATKGTSEAPEGTDASAHLFGTTAAANLCDMRYARADDANGVYLHFAREAAAQAAPQAASAFGSGGPALVGGACLVAGVAIGAGGATLASRRRGRGEAA